MSSNLGIAPRSSFKYLIPGGLIGTALSGTFDADATQTPSSVGKTVNRSSSISANKYNKVVADSNSAIHQYSQDPEIRSFRLA
jgi:hypothetical protein